MKTKNSSGFTLIEMIVTIAVIGALSVVIGVSSSNMLSGSKTTKNRDVFDNLFDNASIYVGLSTSECKPSVGNDCSVTLKMMIEKGLLDEGIVDTDNPMKASGKFTESDSILVKIQATGEKVMSYSCGAKTISSATINKFEDWGKC